jgi:UDP-glucose 4-epimerase
MCIRDSVWNLGSGQGASVLEVVHAYEKACGHPIAYEVKPRRPGDVAASFADPGKANRELGWQATRTLDEMCADTYRWQSANPNGYRAG